MKHVYLFLLLILSVTLLKAQPLCGFDKIHQQMLRSDTAYARQVAATDRSIRAYIQTHPQNLNTTNRVNTIYTIPIVIHIMHTGGAIGSDYNPSDAQINQMVNHLNQVYSGTDPGLTPPSAGGAGDMGIRFQLAARTPTCGYTNGIDRVDASGLANYTASGVRLEGPVGVSDNDLKNFAKWDPSQFYNIWIVNKIDGQDGYTATGPVTAGYSVLPTETTGRIDGIVMSAFFANYYDLTLAHEFGHSFNLYHTFEGSSDASTCPANTDCTTNGDRVCDTDPNSFSGPTCRTGTNPCTGMPYSLKTESNFMSYTRCRSLFTNGQKERVQASMSLPWRSSLVSPSNMALVPCGPVINFTQGADSTTESADDTTDCRRYVDYTYYMNVGAPLSATAVATLTFSGSATRGIDYDVTTNGSFSSPSTSLTFAAGSTAQKSFLVRVYDDASVESAETAVLNFTVNNGGGNAARGTLYPTLTLTLKDNDLALIGSGYDTAQIGTNLIRFATLFDASQTSKRSQMLFKASELHAVGLVAGPINNLQFYISAKKSTTPYKNLSIGIQVVSPNYTNYLFDNGTATIAQYLPPYYRSAAYSTIAGWNIFPLSSGSGSPFNWNGTDNIIVELCYLSNLPTSVADSVSFYSDGGTNAQSNFIYQYGIACNSNYTQYASYPLGLKPMVKFVSTLVPTPIETVAATSDNEYLATGSNDYYYSTNNKLLAKLSGINDTLGCTNVTITSAGNTWQPLQGGTRSQKVFQVTPTQNGSTTSYTASFYFTSAELAGRNPATLRLVKTNAASPNLATWDNSVSITPTVSAQGTGTVFTGTFTGFSYFFLADVAVILPVNLLSFDAKLNGEGNTLVSWSTSTEKDNAYFIVQLSRNGADFSDIGKVLSKGNSSTIQQYSFVHFKPQNGITYYRLKQVDADGHITYSNIAIVNKSALATIQPIVYPVPAKNTLHIQWGATVSKGSIQLLAADMRLLQTQKITTATTNTNLNVQMLPTGVYYLRLHTEEAGSTIIKFIKN